MLSWEAARLIENDPKMSCEMHDNVVSDCEEWHKRKSQIDNTETGQKYISSEHDQGRMNLVYYKKTYYW